MAKRIVIVCPGRGSYTKETLGYLSPYRSQFASFFDALDAHRKAAGDPSITDLDSAPQFRVSLHTKGEHASVLIYACAWLDHQLIDPDRYEVVAITGNSMGWYLALSLGGGLDEGGAFQVIQTMGGMMRDQMVGGQIIHPVVGEDWRPDPEREARLENRLRELRSQPGCDELYLSIRLGGYRVYGGSETALKVALRELPKEGDYPFQLINHAAFHTPLLAEISDRAFLELPVELFHQPHVPLIDGCGRIWSPWSSDREALWRYTLGHQVVEPYDFTAAVTVALKEFNPDHLVLLGPGASLGGSIGQILVGLEWQGIRSKEDFKARQMKDPFLLAMGVPEQREKMVAQGFLE